jgi:hypothetical protein
VPWGDSRGTGDVARLEGTGTVTRPLTLLLLIASEDLAVQATVVSKMLE